jgi:hypothetical protein
LKAVKRFLLLTLLLIVFLAFAGCSGGGGGGTPNVSPTASGGYTTREIDYTDDFSNSTSGWGQMSDDADARYYSNAADDGYGSIEVYIMKIYTGSGTCWAVPYKNKLVNNYTIEVTLKNGLDTQALGGIYFNDNGVDHNVFVIDPKYQRYALAKGIRQGMNWHAMEKTIKPTKWDGIKTNDINIIKVEVNGSLAKLSINGQKVENDITVPIHSDGEGIGIYLSNDRYYNVKMIYDDFHVKGTEIIKN